VSLYQHYISKIEGKYCLLMTHTIKVFSLLKVRYKIISDTIPGREKVNFDNEKKGFVLYRTGFLR